MSTIEIEGVNITTHPHATWQDWNTHLRHDYRDKEVIDVFSYFNSDHDPATCDYSIILHGRHLTEGVRGLEVHWTLPDDYFIGGQD